MSETEDNWRKQLPPELKEKFILPQLELFSSAAMRKTGILPQMSALAAALVVVATFDETLIPLSLQEEKILLSLFLMLIPITLHVFLLSVEGAAENALKIIQSYIDTDLQKSIDEIRDWKSDLAGFFPWVVLTIFYFSVALVLFRLWCG